LQVDAGGDMSRLKQFGVVQKLSKAYDPFPRCFFVTIGHISLTSH
jgi:hypothetical protein